MGSDKMHTLDKFSFYQERASQGKYRQNLYGKNVIMVQRCLQMLSYV